MNRVLEARIRETGRSRTASVRVPLALGIVVVAACSLALCFFAMFSGFGEYDDEGYLLLSLKKYAEGGILYDGLFAQYGPAYFQTATTLFRGLGLPFTHAAGRAIVVGLWLAIALVCAVATYRLAGSAAVALATQILVTQALLPLRSEPLHPGGFLSLALSLLVLAGTAGGAAPGWLRTISLGIFVGAALLMKVNVGLFAGAAVGFALVVRFARTASERVVAAGAFLVVPPAVMGALLAAGWVQDYLLLVEAAALAVVVIELASPSRRRGAGHALAGLIVGTIVTVALVSTYEVARGTSLTGLVRGVVLDPVRHPYVLALPPDLSAGTPAWALLSLGGAIMFALARRRRWDEARLIAALRGPAQLLAGIFIWLAATDLLLVSPLAAVPLLWVALVTPANDLEPHRAAGRSLLVAVAVLQALHAYPVAGSQVAWATVLAIPAGAVAVADGWRATVAAAQPLRLGASRLSLVSTVSGILLLGIVGKLAYDAVDRYRAVYEAGVPLGLPGAEPIRVTPPQAVLYRTLATELKAHCDTFITMPGLNSLYLFSGLEPPTLMNGTVWMTQFTAAQQTAIADHLSRLTIPVCAVRRLRSTWRNPALLATPLGRYIDEQFTTALVVGQYEFMVRRPGPAPASRAAPAA